MLAIYRSFQRSESTMSRFFFSSRRRHTRYWRDWSSDVCSSDLASSPASRGTPDGNYPRLAGLDAGYLARQLRHFKERRRVNIPMVPYTTERELPETDVVTIAGYLSSI